MVTTAEPSDKTERWVGDIYLEITPIKGLVFRSDVSLDLTNTRSKLYKEKYEYSTYDKSEKNFISSNMARYSTVGVENTLTYTRDIKKHSFSAMVGQTTEEYNYYSIGGSGSSILNPTETNWYLSQATEDQTKASDQASRSRRFSLLGRLHYSYNSRYLITMNFRADGSSKFKENLWGYFPSGKFRIVTVSSHMIAAAKIPRAEFFAPPQSLANKRTHRHKAHVYAQQDRKSVV